MLFQAAVSVGVVATLLEALRIDDPIGAGRCAGCAASGESDGLMTKEREELQRLRREVRVLREERNILKRAATLFALETR
jgi:transposase-like protein